jgi:hypothetical protein
MASLRTFKKSSRTSTNEDRANKTSRKQANEDVEETIISSDSGSMDITDDNSEHEPAETQSKSARDLLTDMVAGVRP